MEQRRQRLSLEELHLLRWLLGGTLMILSIATVFYLDIGSEWMAAVAAAGVLVALIWPTLPARVPVWAHRLAFPAIVAFFSVDLWYSRELLPAIVRLDLLLLLYRGISHRARRDDLQIVVLGLFLIVVAGVLTVSLLFAAQILVFTACALGLLMVVTIAASTEGGQAPILAVRGVVPIWAAHADWRRLFRRLREISDWRLVAAATALFVGVVAVSGLLFLAIPRFQLENSLFLERFITKKARTGFSDSIKFGDITEILQDDGVALDVDISDPAQAPAVPYWRMVVLDEYRNGGFRLSAKMRSVEFPIERTNATLRPRAMGPIGAPTWTFYLEAGVSRYLPTIGRYDLLRFREAQNYRYSSDLGLIALRDEPASMTAYRVEGMGPEMSELPDKAFALWLKNRAVKSRFPLQLDTGLSPGDAQVLSRMVSAVGLSADLGSAEFSRRADLWLRRQHSYSLSPVIPDGPGDPLVRWMASREPGHCELFAGALVLLSRSAGIPARVVTGFKGGTWNAYSGNFTIRNSDAHAWAEVWDPKKSAWLREDPLESGSAAAEDEKGAAALAGLMDRSWSARLNSLRVFWYRRIVNFDLQSQADTLKAFKAATDTSGKWLRSTIDALATGIRQWIARPWDAARVARTAASAAGVVTISWILYMVGGRLAAMGRGRRVDPVRREAGRWLRRVEGPPALVADLQRLRYGPVPSWPRPLDVFRTARRAASSRRR
jgi:protein-glutamine gamma-glutamyltransferase